ncbi:GNAT family N-acetyltransferase [Clostridium sp.]|uniref:GNAT family N-acetyltransferase n=1 Tax=Clostridium sp. TaxID=1506 RepID=UPI0026192932|nr:GNAT family N-acetyltransferase [Clostridium sp.]
MRKQILEEIISLQKVKLEESEFLLKIFKESNPELLYICGLGEEEKRVILLQQFTIETKQLMQIYPNAEFNIVMLNEEPIGKLYINYGKTADRIIEIALLEEYRGRGIGKELIEIVIKNAKKAGKNVRLQVAWFNQNAYGLYKKLGFQVIENKEVFFEMEYRIDN